MKITKGKSEVKFFRKDAGGRSRLFSYRDKFFSINLGPILGYKTGSNDGEKNTHIYGTLFINDLSVSNIFNKEKQVNHLGGTVGLSLTDLPLNNLTATLEYSRINPFVYTHYIQTITYTNASYNMGHGIGNNGDVLYGSLKYRFIRGLQAKVWGQYISKWEAGEVQDQYELPHKPFLFGLKTDYTYPWDRNEI